MLKIDLLEVGFSTYAPGTSYGPYTVNNFELVWVNEGRATLTSNGKSHHLLPNSVVLSQPQDQNRYDWDVSHTTRHGYAYFQVDRTATDHESVISLPDLLRVEQLSGDDIIIALLRHVQRLDAERPSGWAQLMGGPFECAVHSLLSAVGRGHASGDSEQLPDPIASSLALVRRRWSSGQSLEPPTLGELARAASVTPEHLARLYRRQFGLGPISVLRSIRLHRAGALLARTNLSVQQVAFQTGFSSQFHFSATFHRATGCAPTTFRSRKRAGVELPPALHRIAATL